MQFSWHIYREGIFKEVRIVSLLSLQIHADDTGLNLPLNLQTSPSFNLGGCVSCALEALCIYAEMAVLGAMVGPDCLCPTKR